MKFIRGIGKAFICAVAVTIGFRPLIGLYSVIGIPAVLLSSAAGIIVAIVLIGRDGRGFFLITSCHIFMLAGTSILTEKWGLFKYLAEDTADKLSAVIGIRADGFSMIKCILVFVSVYLISLIVSVVVLTKNTEDEDDYDPYDEYESL